jgi:hypothetical protein
MITINSNTNIFSLINEIPEGIHTYYNKRYRRFEYHYESDIDNGNLIKTPCAYEMKADFKATFYANLTEEQAKIARSYPFRRGYFDYLKEEGLYEIYAEAEYYVKLKAIIVWFIKNNICFPRNNIDVDCRYLF